LALPKVKNNAYLTGSFSFNNQVALKNRLNAGALSQSSKSNTASVTDEETPNFAKSSCSDVSLSFRRFHLQFLAALLRGWVQGARSKFIL